MSMISVKRVGRHFCMLDPLSLVAGECVAVLQRIRWGIFTNIFYVSGSPFWYRVAMMARRTIYRTELMMVLPVMFFLHLVFQPDGEVKACWQGLADMHARLHLSW
jgi:hypothetical protein